MVFYIAVEYQNSIKIVHRIVFDNKIKHKFVISNRYFCLTKICTKKYIKCTFTTFINSCLYS